MSSLSWVLQRFDLVSGVLRGRTARSIRTHSCLGLQESEQCPSSQVGGSDVRPAAKPPQLRFCACRPGKTLSSSRIKPFSPEQARTTQTSCAPFAELPLSCLRLEIAVVEVHGGTVGIPCTPKPPLRLTGFQLLSIRILQFGVRMRGPRSKIFQIAPAHPKTYTLTPPRPKISTLQELDSFDVSHKILNFKRHAGHLWMHYGGQSAREEGDLLPGLQLSTCQGLFRFRGRQPCAFLALFSGRFLPNMGEARKCSP